MDDKVEKEQSWEEKKAIAAAKLGIKPGEVDKVVETIGILADTVRTCLVEPYVKLAIELTQVVEKVAKAKGMTTEEYLEWLQKEIDSETEAHACISEVEDTEDGAEVSTEETQGKEG